MSLDSQIQAAQHALASIEHQVAALRDQLAAAQAREQLARSALAQMLEAVVYLVDTDDSLAEASAAARRILDGLYQEAGQVGPVVRL